MVLAAKNVSEINYSRVIINIFLAIFNPKNTLSASPEKPKKHIV